MIHDISLHLMDLAVNSIKAGADTLELVFCLSEGVLRITVRDNGCGISERCRVRLENDSCPAPGNSGRGVMLFRDACRKTGGMFSVMSDSEQGTRVSASFRIDSSECPLLGDPGETVSLLLTGNRGLRIKLYLKRENSNGTEFSYGFDSDLALCGTHFHTIGKYYWIKEEINKGVMNIFGGVFS